MIKELIGIWLFTFSLIYSLMAKNFESPNEAQFDSLRWEISIYGGPNYLDISRFKAANKQSTSSFLNLRLAREFSSIIQMHLQFGFSKLDINDHQASTLTGNPVQMFYGGTGFVLNFTRSKFQPYFKFDFGLVSYGKGNFINESNALVELQEERGDYFQLGFGFKILSKNGIGIKMEVDYQDFFYPNIKGASSNTNNSNLTGAQVGFGLVKLF